MRGQGLGGSGEIEDDDGGVVVGSLLGTERVELGENTFNGLLTSAISEAAESLFEPLDGIELALGVPCFDDAVGLEEERTTEFSVYIDGMSAGHSVIVKILPVAIRGIRWLVTKGNNLTRYRSSRARAELSE